MSSTATCKTLSLYIRTDSYPDENGYELKNTGTGAVIASVADLYNVMAPNTAYAQGKS